MKFNPFRNVAVGTRSELFPPFRWGISVDGPVDIPLECYTKCTWVPRRDGKYHLKYINRLCIFHGGLL